MIMAIQFKEIRQYLARNARLSICFEDGYYQDYLMVSDIPTEKYKDLYVYGIGMVDVEFPKDIYTSSQNLDDASSSIKIKECTFEPAIDIVLHKIPRDIKRKAEELLLFKDIKPYLQIGRNFAVVNREDWSYRLYEWKRDIPDEYDDKFVFGIGMEDNFDESDKDIIKALEKRSYDSCMNKRSRPLSHYGRMLPDYCEDIGVTSFGSYDVLMTEVANGFFYNGGGKITLK